MNVLILLGSPLRAALVGGLSAVIFPLLFLGISLLVYWLKSKISKQEQKRMGSCSKIEVTNDVKEESVIECLKECGQERIKCEIQEKTNNIKYGLNMEEKQSQNGFKRTMKAIWKLFLKVVLVFFCIVCLCLLFALGFMLYHDHQYKEGLSDINRAPEIAKELIDSRFPVSYTDEAVEVLTNAAEHGNVESMLLLGRYYKGYDIKSYLSYSTNRFLGNNNHYGTNPEKSSYWYLQAAKKGNCDAQGEIGHSYLYGIGLERSFEKAFYWLTLGAEGGDAKAQLRLGNVYRSGLAYYYITYRGDNVWWFDGHDYISISDSRNILTLRENSHLKNRKPDEVYLSPDISKAKYYWTLAANQGLSEAKDCLQRIYEGDD